MGRTFDEVFGDATLAEIRDAVAEHQGDAEVFARAYMTSMWPSWGRDYEEEGVSFEDAVAAAALLARQAVERAEEDE